MPREGRHRSVEDASWVDQEIAACKFADVRLGRRVRNLLEQIGDAVGESVPMACQDWANAKAAYRFFSNKRVNEADILSGHFEATRERFSAGNGPVLVLCVAGCQIASKRDPSYAPNNGSDADLVTTGSRSTYDARLE